MKNWNCGDMFLHTHKFVFKFPPYFYQQEKFTVLAHDGHIPMQNFCIASLHWTCKVSYVIRPIVISQWLAQPGF